MDPVDRLDLLAARGGEVMRIEESYNVTLHTGERLHGRIHARHEAGITALDPQIAAGISVIDGSGLVTVLAERDCKTLAEARGFLATHGLHAAVK